MTISAMEIRPREAPDRLLARYHAVDGLIDRALAAIARHDVAEAVLVSYAVMAKCHVLDERLGLVDLRDGGGRPRPPKAFQMPVPTSASRRRRSRR